MPGARGVEASGVRELANTIPRGAVLVHWADVASAFSRLPTTGERAEGHRFRDVPLTELASQAPRDVSAARETLRMRGGASVFSLAVTDIDSRF